MLPDEVRNAVERATLMAGRDGDWVELDDADWQTIRAHLLARESEVERLQAIEKERWDVVATRNAAVMRAERAEALLRECHARLSTYHPADQRLANRITAHLSENSRDA